MDVRRWLKGNLHTHTVRSDGDATVEQAAAFYAEHGYDFLIITDHNRFLRPDEFLSLSPRPDFLLIGGSELSGKAMLPPAPVDVCSLGGFAADPSKVAGLIPRTPAHAVRSRVAAARSAGGVPMVCHPCWKWALSADDLLTIEGDFLLEVFNASSDCNNHSAGGVDSPEEIWSKLLSAGRRVWGTATDDAHRIAKPVVPTHDGGALAWVRVDVGQPGQRTEQAVLQSLAAGKLYSSTGVELEELDAGPDIYRVRVTPVNDRRYTTIFLGRDNRELARQFGLEAAWRIRGDEGFIRARIEDTAGCRCWTQPRFV